MGVAGSFSSTPVFESGVLTENGKRLGTAVIVVTHDENIIPVFKRVYRLRDGILHEEPAEGRSIGWSRR